MIALFEAGSSHLHTGWWDGATVIGQSTSSYRDDDSIDTNFIKTFLRSRSFDLIAACSVSARRRDPLFRFLQTIAPGTISCARTATDVGLTVSYTRPETYGIDRALAVVEAFHRIRGACVVVDIGTAVTVDAVTVHGDVAGGFIIPGAELMARSLVGATDLPQVVRESFDPLPGDSTESGISRGIGLGITGAIDRLIAAAQSVLGDNVPLMLTGGGATGYTSHLKPPVMFAPDLVLAGLGRSAHRLPRTLVK